MEYKRITSIADPLFAALHQLLGHVFPSDEVLAFEAWREPLRDETLRVCVAVADGEAVGATEYRYMRELQVAMFDFTIIGRSGMGVGPFLWQQREADLQQMTAGSGTTMLGTFAEIYKPEHVADHPFGAVREMHPAVRREVLSHLGFKRLDFPFVHPSWQDNGEPVEELDLAFRPVDPGTNAIPAQLVADFQTAYYDVLPNKPKAWYDMVERLRSQERIALRPL